MRVRIPHQTRMNVSLNLNTIESLFDLVQCGCSGAEKQFLVFEGLALLLCDPYFASKTGDRRC